MCQNETFHTVYKGKINKVVNELSTLKNEIDIKAIVYTQRIKYAKAVN